MSLRNTLVGKWGTWRCLVSLSALRALHESLVAFSWLSSRPCLRDGGRKEQEIADSAALPSWPIKWSYMLILFMGKLGRGTAMPR